VSDQLRAAQHLVQLEMQSNRDAKQDIFITDFIRIRIRFIGSFVPSL